MAISQDQSSSGGINTAFVSNEYFTAESLNSNFLGFTSSPYVVLRSKNKTVDVFGEMHWSNFGDKSEVPEVFVIEKELQYGAWANELANLLNQGRNLTNNRNIDSYVQLYAAKETGFYYNFPWLLKNGDNIRNIENQWKSIEGISKTLTDMVGSDAGKDKGGFFDTILPAAAGAVVGAFTPGFGFEETKQFDNTSSQSLTITFPLYNTLDVKTAIRHFSFVNLFTFQNLKTRTSLMSYIPPKIYEVDAYSLGGIYMPAAVVTNFKIDSVGTTRKITDWGLWGNAGILIPEAYKVTITFTDLLSQSSNVFAGTLGGNKIRITNTVPELTTAAQLAQNTNQTLGPLVQGAFDRIENGIDQTNTFFRNLTNPTP
jgi:hypothetical protein